MAQAPLNNHDLAWIQEQVAMQEAEDKVQGVTMSEVLYGGPRGEGLVHIVKHIATEVIPGLVEVSKSLAERVEALEKYNGLRVAAEQAKATRDQRWNDNWTWVSRTIAGGVLLLVIRMAYLLLQPPLASHGIHLPGSI